jgi:hypothetical protein
MILHRDTQYCLSVNTKEADFILTAGRTERKHRRIDTPYSTGDTKSHAPQYGTDVLEHLICVIM